jgi:predicted naringenin-chalcone synthase
MAVRLCRLDAEQARLLGTLYRQSGIDRRHLIYSEDQVWGILAEEEAAGERGPGTRVRMRWYAREAPPLALRAARAALGEAGWPPDAVTHLVTVSCTGFGAPGVDVALMTGLGLRPTTVRTHVGFMGCHGAINGLRAAQAYGEADPAARVLVCAVELCSLHFFFGWDPKRLVANALFADGAAAAVGQGDTDPSLPPGGWRLRATGSCLFPDTAQAMTWDIGDHGFEMTLSTKVPGLIAANLRPWLEEWLGGLGLRLADVASWCVHPGGPRVLVSVEEALGVTPAATAASREVLAGHGNMSSPTVLFILDRLRRRDAPRPCVSLGFGPGLVAEAALFD